MLFRSVTAIYKDQGYPINNDEIEAAAAMLDNMPVESARFEYSGDGTLKSGTKSNGTWGSFVEVGKYRLEGNKLIIVVEGITAVQTINSLDQNELIIESTKDSILAIYGNDVYSEALAMYERIGYNWRSITVYLRVS